MLTTLLALSIAATPTYKGSDLDEEQAEKGRTLVRELAVDLDGDGRSEVVVIRKRAGKHSLSILAYKGDVEDQDFRTLLSTDEHRADKVVYFEARSLLGVSKKREVVVVFEERSPDETLQHVRIVGHTERGMMELFGRSFHVEDKTPKGAIPFGDASPRVSIKDVDDEDGPLELVWTRDPIVLELEGEKGTVQLLIGAVKTVFRYNSARGQFVQDEEAINEDFLVPKTPWEVEASAQVPKIWGTAQAAWGADGDLDTAWTLAGRKRGVGESIKVSFKHTEEVSFIRVVPGCARNPDDWEIYDQIRSFRIEMSNGAKFSIDRQRLGRLPGPVRAAGEFSLEGEFGAQVLLLLEKPDPIRWLRLTIERVQTSVAPRRRRARETCMAEISFH